MTPQPRQVVVAVLYPEWYHPPEEWERLAAELAAVEPGIEVVRAPYEEPTDVRAQRGAGVTGNTGIAPLTAEQEGAFGRMEVALAMDLPHEVGSVAPRLRWVQGVGAGVGQLQSAGLAESGIRLTTGAGLSAVSISEFVIGRLMEVWKDTDRLTRLQRDHEWGVAHGRTFAGSTVGLVGLGAIGGELARRLSAFDVEIIGCRSRPEAPPVEGVDRVVGVDRLDELLTASDVVVSAVPDTPDTRDLFDADRFAAMAEGAVFVNVGRGSAVVEADLIAALESGRLGAAILDVARAEPLPADDPLWDAPRVKLSPHVAASADRYMENLHSLFRDNLDRYLTGEPLRNEVDHTRGY